MEADTGRAPATDPGCGAGRCREARRGLCAIPPRREDRRPAPCPAHGEGNMLLTCYLGNLMMIMTEDWPETNPNTEARAPCPGGQRGEVSYISKSTLHIYTI